MNNIKKISALLLIICVVFTCFAGCSKDKKGKSEFIDYAAQVKLDFGGGNNIAEVTIKQCIDGDTTHFNINDPTFDGNVIKARYLAVNTPESTGQIEEWGKAASKFTKEKLESAVSIAVESETASWNADSTGERFLVWVWYKPDENSEYRNLNIELLQEGLAIASATSSTKYGEIGMKAIEQAKVHKKNVHSGAKDPDFYYGDCIELTLKELRANPDKYVGKNVAFTGVVTRDDGNNGIFVEAFDEETNMYHGIAVYYGFTPKYGIPDIIKPGNKIRVVGSMQYYEAGDTYQISDLDYDMMNPKDPDKLMLLEKGGHNPAYVETTAENFAKGKVSVTIIDEGEETIKEFDYSTLAIGTSISMKGLTVKSVYTTNNGGDSDGALTLTCSAGGHTITVRTAVLKDKNDKLITENYFKGKTIDVKGIVNTYSGKPQIQLLSIDDVTVR